MAIASLVLGILSLLLSWIPVVNIIALILCVLSFIFAIISISKDSNSSKAMSITGLITSIISFGIIAFLTIVFGMIIMALATDNSIDEDFHYEYHYENELYSTYSINEDVKLNDRVIKVDKVERSEGNENYKAKADNEFVFVTISTKNISVYDILYSCDDFKLIDKNHREYECDYNKIQSNTTFTKGSIEPEKVVTGVLCFEIPKDSENLVIQYQDYVYCINISLE